MDEQVTVPEEKLLLDKMISFFQDNVEKLKVLAVNAERPEKLLLKNLCPIFLRPCVWRACKLNRSINLCVKLRQQCLI